MNNLRFWFKSGSPWIWLNAGAVSVSMSIVIGLLLLIALRGFGHFWPGDVTAFTFDYFANSRVLPAVGAGATGVLARGS